MSLRLRLIQTITLVLLGTLFVGGLLIYWHAGRKIDTEMRAAIAVGGRIVRNAVDDIEEISNTTRRLKLIVRDFDGDRHLRAALLGPLQNVVTRSEWAKAENPAPQWLHALFSAPPRVIVIQLPSQYAKFGRIVLQTDASNEIAEVWADAKLYGMLLASFCAAVLAVLYIALGHALKPLRNLLEGFEKIGKGDQPEAIRVSGPSELSQLAQGFNAMADSLVAMKDRNARLREQLETVQEEERTELARNLHDEVSPLLFSVDVDATNVAQLAQSSLDATSSERLSVLEKISENAGAIKGAVVLLKSNVKAILTQLRPAGLHALSLKNTIEDLTTFWKARNRDLEFSLSVPEKSWGVKIDSAVQSIVRESLSNAMKHSKPSHISIDIREDAIGSLIVAVRDDGGGFSRASAGDGLGVVGMRERALLLGGTLTVDEVSKPGGVIVRAKLPVSYADLAKHAHDQLANSEREKENVG